MVFNKPKSNNGGGGATTTKSSTKSSGITNTNNNNNNNNKDGAYSSHNNGNTSTATATLANNTKPFSATTAGGGTGTTTTPTSSTPPNKDATSRATSAALAKAKEVIRNGGTQAEAAAAAKEVARRVLKENTPMANNGNSNNNNGTPNSVTSKSTNTTAPGTIHSSSANGGGSSSTPGNDNTSKSTAGSTSSPLSPLSSTTNAAMSARAATMAMHRKSRKKLMTTGLPPIGPTSGGGGGLFGKLRSKKRVKGGTRSSKKMKKGKKKKKTTAAAAGLAVFSSAPAPSTAPSGPLHAVDEGAPSSVEDGRVIETEGRDDIEVEVVGSSSDKKRDDAKEGGRASAAAASSSADKREGRGGIAEKGDKRETIAGTTTSTTIGTKKTKKLKLSKTKRFSLSRSKSNSSQESREEDEERDDRSNAGSSYSTSTDITGSQSASISTYEYSHSQADDLSRLSNMDDDFAGGADGGRFAVAESYDHYRGNMPSIYIEDRNESVSVLGADTIDKDLNLLEAFGNLNNVMDAVDRALFPADTKKKSGGGGGGGKKNKSKSIGVGGGSTSKKNGNKTKAATVMMACDPVASAAAASTVKSNGDDSNKPESNCSWLGWAACGDRERFCAQDSVSDDSFIMTAPADSYRCGIKSRPSCGTNSTGGNSGEPVADDDGQYFSKHKNLKASSASTATDAATATSGDPANNKVARNINDTAAAAAAANNAVLANAVALDANRTDSSGRSASLLLDVDREIEMMKNNNKSVSWADSIDGRDVLNAPDNSGTNTQQTSKSYDSSLFNATARGAVNGKKMRSMSVRTGASKGSTFETISTIGANGINGGVIVKDKNGVIINGIGSVNGLSKASSKNTKGTNASTLPDGAESVSSKMKNMLKNTINPLWGNYFPGGQGQHVLDQSGLNNSGHNNANYYPGGVPGGALNTGVRFGAPGPSLAPPATGHSANVDNPNWRDMVADTAPAEMAARPMSPASMNMSSVGPSSPQHKHQQQQGAYSHGGFQHQQQQQPPSQYQHPGGYPGSPQGLHLQHNPPVPLQLSPQGLGGAAGYNSPSMRSPISSPQGHYGVANGQWNNAPPDNSPSIAVGGRGVVPISGRKPSTANSVVPRINSNLSEESVDAREDRYAGMNQPQPQSQQPQIARQDEQQQAVVANAGPYHSATNGTSTGGYNPNNGMMDAGHPQGMEPMQTTATTARQVTSSPALNLLMSDDSDTGLDGRYNGNNDLSPRSVGLNGYDGPSNNSVRHQNQYQYSPMHHNQGQQPQQQPPRQYYTQQQQQRNNAIQQIGGQHRPQQQQQQQQHYGQSNNVQASHQQHQGAVLGHYQDTGGMPQQQQQPGNVRGYGIQHPTMQSSSQPVANDSRPQRPNNNHMMQPPQPYQQQQALQQQQHPPRPPLSPATPTAPNDGYSNTNVNSNVNNSSYHPQPQPHRVDPNPSSIGYYGVQTSTATNNNSNQTPSHQQPMSPQQPPTSPGGYRTFAA